MTGQTANIRPELQHLAEPLDAVTTYPGNARRGDLTRIKASLTAHGQYAPLLVQASTGHIIKGNNTHQAMLGLGWTHGAVQRVDVDDDRAREILLLDNRASDDAGYDSAALAELLADVTDWDATGFTADDLDDLLLSLPSAIDATAMLPAGVAPAPLIPGPPTILPAPPATDATYAETPDEQAARQARIATQVPAAAKGFVEMIFVLTHDDREEAGRLLAAMKAWLGPDLSHGDLVLRALRVGAVLADAAADPGGSIAVAALRRAAGAPEDT